MSLSSKHPAGPIFSLSMTDVLLARGGFTDDTGLLRLHHAADLSVRTVGTSLTGVSAYDIAPFHRMPPACVLFSAGTEHDDLDGQVLRTLELLSAQHPWTAFVACVTSRHGAVGWAAAVSRLLASGADEVVSLHDEPLELMARLAARVRRVRHQRPTEGVTWTSGRAHRPRLDVERRELVGAGGRVELTAKEVTVLGALAAADGVVARDALAASLWTGHWSGTPKAIDMHIANLRRKLPQACGDTWRIDTVRGAGFVLTQTEDAAEARVGHVPWGA